MMSHELHLTYSSETRLAAIEKRLIPSVFIMNRTNLKIRFESAYLSLTLNLLLFSLKLTLIQTKRKGLKDILFTM